MLVKTQEEQLQAGAWKLREECRVRDMEELMELEDELMSEFQDDLASGVPQDVLVDLLTHYETHALLLFSLISMDNFKRSLHTGGTWKPEQIGEKAPVYHYID